MTAWGQVKAFLNALFPLPLLTLCGQAECLCSLPWSLASCAIPMEYKKAAAAQPQLCTWQPALYHSKSKTVFGKGPTSQTCLAAPLASGSEPRKAGFGCWTWWWSWPTFQKKLTEEFGELLVNVRESGRVSFLSQAPLATAGTEHQKEASLDQGWFWLMNKLQVLASDPGCT